MKNIFVSYLRAKYPLSKWDISVSNLKWQISLIENEIYLSTTFSDKYPLKKHEIYLSATLSDKYPWSKMKYICQLPLETNIPYQKEIYMSAILSDTYPWSKMKCICQLSKSDKYPLSKIWNELYLSATFRNKYPLPRIWNEIYLLATLETNTSDQKWIIKLFNRWDCLIYHLSVRVLSDGRMLLHALLCFSCDVCWFVSYS